MKRKTIITILCLTMGLSIVACGKQETTSTTESVQSETTVTDDTEPTETVETTEPTEEIDEITDNIVYPDVNPEDVDPKTTNMDGDTAMALSKKEGAEIDEKYGSSEAWTAHAQSQGADATMGWCWVYDTGKGAGSEESYAVYMKEGSPRYGEIFHLGDYLPCGTLFTGHTMEEHGIADDREFQRMYENGEFGDGLTIDENGDIIIE